MTIGKICKAYLPNKLVFAQIALRTFIASSQTISIIRQTAQTELKSNWFSLDGALELSSSSARWRDKI